MNALLLPLAVLLDGLVGDPPFGGHPVRLIGRFAAFVENALYPRAQSRFSCALGGTVGGAVGWSIVVGVAAAVSMGAIALSKRVHPLFGAFVEVVAVYTAIAPRDLAKHARRVQRDLENEDLPMAREHVGWIVGRDTEGLDSTEVSRAAVETVAESTVDGVTAPLFWALLFGGVGAIVYRAVNTLDSMWGHRDERYARFGTVAARADDVLNYVPARLTLVVIALAAWLLRFDGVSALRVGVRQSSRHASPNSGWSEAAFAGALRVTLGGTNRYDGVAHEGPTFGIVSHRADTKTIGRAIALMWATTLLFAALGALFLWSMGRVNQI
ncbi:MAG: adenosylcobinamide-phosphate synthase CbiB [Polyangiaceae bacterium]